jgi:hypothetical protein
MSRIKTRGRIRKELRRSRSFFVWNVFLSGEQEMPDRHRDPREHGIVQATASHLIPGEKFLTLPSTVLYRKKLTLCRTTQAAGVSEIACSGGRAVALNCSRADWLLEDL